MPVLAMPGTEMTESGPVPVFTLLAHLVRKSIQVCCRLREANTFAAVRKMAAGIAAAFHSKNLLSPMKGNDIKKLDETKQGHRDLIRCFLLEADPIGYYEPEWGFHNEYDYCISRTIELINMRVPAAEAARVLLEKMLGPFSEDEEASDSDRDYYASEGFQSRLRKLVVDFGDFVQTL